MVTGPLGDVQFFVAKKRTVLSFASDTGKIKKPLFVAAMVIEFDVVVAGRNAGGIANIFAASVGFKKSFVTSMLAKFATEEMPTSPGHPKLVEPDEIESRAAVWVAR